MVNLKSPLRELALFAGAGGGILGGKLLGWQTVCAVEWEPYAACVLAARQNDGLLPPFPIWDDIQTFDGRPWRGIVDVVSGGFPCQDISAAGKGAGIDGERSGMWREMARVIREVRPRFVFVENSPMLTSRGLGTVLGDLAELGFDARWGVLGAADVGAPHQRDRIWIVARRRDFLSHAEHNRDGRGQQQSEGIEETHGEVANSNRKHDALRGNGQDHAEAMAGWSNDPGRSVNDSGPGCPQSTRESSGNVADTINQGLWSCGRGNGKQSDGEDRPGDHHKTGSRADVAPSKVGKPSDMETQTVLADTERAGSQGRNEQCSKSGTKLFAPIGSHGIEYESKAMWGIEPDVGRVAHGVAARVDRLKAIGNGQVPLCAAAAWRELSELL